MEVAMDRLLRTALENMVRRGSLQVRTATDHTYHFGDGTGEAVAVRFTNNRAQYSLLADPELRLGELFMDGDLVLEQGTIADLLALVMSQDAAQELSYWIRPQWMLRYLKRRLAQYNPRIRARHNVAHHYDLDGQLYSLFLDCDRQYSCAYFHSPDDRLDDAQFAKKVHIGAKLLVRPGHNVLDIGCGWGGLGVFLADCGARVTGITLSQEQHAIANGRAGERGIADRVSFHIQDYRDVEGTFDRIVSVGMFEHIGVGFYDTFFRKCANLLAEDGVMVLHSIGRSEGPGVTNPWIAKYIFPGGYIPALSEVLSAVEHAGLLVTDIEVLRLHYAETLKHWRERFLAHREEAKRLYDERFCRMWEFYLAASEMAFRWQNMMVFQLQLTRKQGVVPITRDYIAREEARLAALAHSASVPLQMAGE